MITNRRCKNPRCPECHSTYTWKVGKRVRWSDGRKVVHQAYQCQDCGHQWRGRNEKYS